MNLSSTESKKQLITSWVRKMSNSDSKIIVSNYCYNCLFTGDPRTKTLIIIPDEIETKGIISIDKPIHKVEIPDIIKLYKRVNEGDRRNYSINNNQD